MIAINNNNLSIFAEEHLEAIRKHLNNSKTKFTYDNIDQWFRRNGSNLSFEEVVLADANKLIKIKNAYRGSDISDEIKYIKNTLYSTYFANSSNYLIDTEYNAAKLVEKLEIIVCPYCNRNYINNVTYASRGIKRTSQMDHFYCKEKYPFLAMSFYNLIPSCASCNHIKSNKRIYYSPYDTRFKSGDMMRFNYKIKSIDFVSDPSQIEINISPLNELINSNLSIFLLESQYTIHKDVVQELLKKKIIYTDSKIIEMMEDFGDIFKNDEDIKRTLFGNYLNENDLHKRPLAKLMSDIYGEIFEIR